VCQQLVEVAIRIVFLHQIEVPAQQIAHRTAFIPLPVKPPFTASWVFDGKPQETDQEWAEICYVPNWAGHSRKRADYRFLAIREPLRRLPLGDEAQPPFPTQEFGHKGIHRLFGVVTNRKAAGDQVIWWLRERCGKSEEVHSVMKTDLAGGRCRAHCSASTTPHNLNTPQ
jgi:hypothetical protein